MSSAKVTGAGGKGFSAEIRIEGLEQTLGALRALRPDVLKRLQRELKEAAAPVIAAAAGSAPPGHSLSYRVQMSNRGKKAGMKIRARDRDSAIFEFAGTKMSNRSGSGPPTPQGAAMIKWLDGFGKPGRFLWAAWDAREATVIAGVRRAMAAAEHELQAELSRSGEVF